MKRLFNLMQLTKTLIICLVIVGSVCTLSPDSFAQEATPKLSGYLKTHVSYSPGTDKDESEINVGNARLKFAGTINSKTDYSIFIDAVRKDVLLDAYVVHKLTSNLSVKAGQFRTPYSTENLTSLSKIAFVNRSLLKYDASPHFRDKGIAVTYSTKKFDLIMAVMNAAGQNQAETNNNKAMSSRAVIRLIPQLQITGNFSTGKYDASNEIRDEFTNVGANGNTGGWEYSAEYARKENDSLTRTAFFAYAAYDIDVDLPSISLLTPAFRVEVSDPDTDMDDDSLSRYTVGLTVHFGKKYSDRVMFNYIIRKAETGDADDIFALEYMVKY